LVIHFTRNTAPQRPQHPSAVSGGRSIPFPYENSHAVLWRYAPPGSRKEKATDISSLSAKVTNIIGLSGITHRGRVFAPPSLPIQPANTKGKARMTEGQNVKVIPAPDEDISREERVVARERYHSRRPGSSSALSNKASSKSLNNSTKPQLESPFWNCS